MPCSARDQGEEHAMQNHTLAPHRWGTRAQYVQNDRSSINKPSKKFHTTAQQRAYVAFLVGTL